MPLHLIPPPEAELLDVLSGIDADTVKYGTPGPSVNVVLSEDVLSSEQAFEDFTDQSESTTPPVVTPKRKRRKHELDHLRAVATELEKKLKMLNRVSDDHQHSDTDHFWKHISNQLMTERQRAVGENARLRQLIREQVKSVKAMQRALDKTPDQSVECSVLSGTTQCQSPTSKDLYRDLFKSISSSYISGIGNLLLHQPGMPAPSLVGKRKMNLEVETGGECEPRMYLQFVESRLIPFSLVRIGDHAWDFLSSSNGHEDFQMALHNQGNELFGHCTVTNTSGFRQSLGNIAVRRYYESNKLTFMWKCDGLCSHDDASTSMRVRQKGSCVFEPAEEDPQNATIFRACVRMTPTIEDNSDSFTESAKAVGQTTEIVIENYEKTVVYIFDTVLESLACEAPNKAG
ncbi:uncharacterized protein PITG_01830 [Phytophthora infestans T30-4]|uniref:M96 mating-specific protein family n=1 Tax=Phytophthora infestans (strain T30-4) TaxID=403677 RepID=D0MU70_PHYIT|nr:uncharacterized protein PITG_01830 [Phytophthora infestans T30-4]EEY61517.1 conserved hypothetical protein [Phytophthora infestans T30-4]|eukprot:XP_002908434.1 conserved hypothetical protein [Phytophthora infestans T30-4]